MTAYFLSIFGPGGLDRAKKQQFSRGEPSWTNTSQTRMVARFFRSTPPEPSWTAPGPAVHPPYRVDRDWTKGWSSVDNFA